MAGIDRLLTAAALRAEGLGRYSWRFGRLVQLGTIALHESLWRLRLRLGWSLPDADSVKAAQENRPKALPRRPYPSLSSLTNSWKLDELLRGIDILDDGTKINLETLSWIQNPSNGSVPALPLSFHALLPVGELVDAFSLNGKTEYLECAKRLTEKWISECLYTERFEPVWDDHGTAWRALVLCHVWDASREREPQGSLFMRNLYAAIIRHAEKLALESFYRPEHNHGVTQAYALMAIGLLFPLHSKAKEWTKLGHARLEAQMSLNVSSEGIHREHSPSYQFGIFRQFYYAHSLAEAYGLGCSLEYKGRLGRMLSAGGYVIKPDGTLPAVGDTWKTAPRLIDKADLNGWEPGVINEYLYSKTRGAEGARPSKRSILFPDGGYAFFRSGWGAAEDFEDERFLALRLSTFNTAHIHRDVFSFELYAYGADLIVDSGGPYDYGNPSMRKYFTSTAAHNTVVVDGQSQQLGEARVLQWETAPQHDFLLAEHRNYPGVIHRRAILFVHPDYFLIFDQLEAEQPHRYSQLFHLDPELEVTPQGLAVKTMNLSGGPTLRIVPLLEEDLSLAIHRGTMNPPQGWVCRGLKKMVPSSVVDYHRAGPQVSFAVLVVPEQPGKCKRVNGWISGKPFRTETRIELAVGDRNDEIVLAPVANGRTGVKLLTISRDL